MKYIYAVMLAIEYGILLYSVNQTLYYNYNNINDDSTAILIPFGGSALKDKLPTLNDVLKNATAIVGGNAVFLLHNGRKLKPELYEEIRQVCAKYAVNYAYLPLPNKSYPIYYCSKNLCQKYRQCLIIDDDVILPANIYLPTLDNYDVMAYPICVDKTDAKSWWQKMLCDFQNIEYGLAGMVKIAQARWHHKSTALFHHGAIGLWKRDVLIDVMRMHDTVFNGEDLNMGIIAFNLGYHMKVVDGYFIPTKTPMKIFGNGGLCAQRYRGWDSVLLKYFPIYLKLFFITPIMNNLILKICLFYESWTTFMDFQRFPIFAYILYNHHYEVAIFLVGITITNILIVIWYNYITIIDFENKTKLCAIILNPIYKAFLITLRFIGIMRELFLYKLPQFPSLIKFMPELPNISDDISIPFAEIDWSKLWKSDEYLHRGMRVQSSDLIEVKIE